MKDKILYLILGILIGAVITSVIFLFFVKPSNPGGRGERPGMMQDENGNFVRPEGMERPDTNTIPDGERPPDMWQNTTSDVNAVQ